MFFWTVLALCSVLANVISEPNIPCKVTDANCLTKIGVNAFAQLFDGDPELGIENLDPMHQDLVEGNLSQLKFKLVDTTIKGFKSCKIENLKLTSSNSLHVDLLCPKFVMYGQYVLKGRLISLPVAGNGDYRIDTNKYKISIEAEIKIASGKDGKSYLSVKSFRQTSEPLESVNFDFKNLFNGQKDLAETVLKFANENWREVAMEVQEPIMKANLKKIVKNSNKFFKKVAIEDLLSM